MRLFELIPYSSYNHQKSFYHKAFWAYGDDYDDDNIIVKTLYSYNIPVVTITICVDSNTVYIEKLWSGYSATTMRHIREFLNQNIGRNSLNICKQWWENLTITTVIDGGEE